jgi:hypothetical protein
VPDAEDPNNPDLLAPGITSSRVGIVAFGALRELRAVVELKLGDPGAPGEAPKLPIPGEALRVDPLSLAFGL